MDIVCFHIVVWKVVYVNKFFLGWLSQWWWIFGGFSGFLLLFFFAIIHFIKCWLITMNKTLEKQTDFFLNLDFGSSFIFRTKSKSLGRFPLPFYSFVHLFIQIWIYVRGCVCVCIQIVIIIVIVSIRREKLYIFE